MDGEMEAGMEEVLRLKFESSSSPHGKKRMLILCLCSHSI